MNEQFSIAGKVAVITGAGGVLGGSIAKCFMEQGAKVVAVDIRQEQLDKRVEELKAYGEDVIGIVGNVLDIASLEKLADDIVAKWGRIDILLNIAGGNMPGATLALSLIHILLGSQDSRCQLHSVAGKRTRTEVRRRHPCECYRSGFLHR